MKQREARLAARAKLGSESDKRATIKAARIASLAAIGAAVFSFAGLSFAASINASTQRSIASESFLKTQRLAAYSQFETKLSDLVVLMSSPSSDNEMNQRHQDFAYSANAVALIGSDPVCIAARKLRDDVESGFRDQSPVPFAALVRSIADDRPAFDLAARTDVQGVV